MQQFLIPAKPDLQAAREGWLKMLSRERRLAALTLDAYERDTRQFLHFLTGHLGGAPGPCRCRASQARRSPRLPGEPPRRRRRRAHARARPRRGSLAAALSRAAGPRQCGRSGGAACAQAAEIAAQAADGRRRQARRLGRRAARRRTMDRRAQCRGADAALWLGPAHLRGARADRGRPRQRARCGHSHHRQGRQDAAGAGAAHRLEGRRRIQAALPVSPRSAGICCFAARAAVCCSRPSSSARCASCARR